MAISEKYLKFIADNKSEISGMALEELVNFLLSIFPDSKYDASELSETLALLQQEGFAKITNSGVEITSENNWDYSHSTELSPRSKVQASEIGNWLYEISQGDGSFQEDERSESEAGDIKKPFDVSKIDIESTTLVLQNIIDRLEHKELALDTEFQRMAGVWDHERKSRLIESILIRFPLPAFYFDSSDDKKWLIVDGLQRITTIKEFVLDETLKLSGLEFLDSETFNGKSFGDLPRDFQRRVKETKITAYLIKAGTPDEVKFNLFKRINTGGMPLSAQEIRHALNQGKPADWVKKLSKLEVFKKATGYSINPSRMLDRDYVTRFLAFYLSPYDKYVPDLDDFLNKQMASIKLLDEQDYTRIEVDFAKALKTAKEIFGKFAFRKQPSYKEQRRPLNKALFEVITSSFARLDQEKCNTLIEKKVEFGKRLARKFKYDGNFSAPFSVSTGSRKNVINRHRLFMELVNEVLQS